MKLLPIEVDEKQNYRFGHNPECREILQVYPGFYKRVGFHKPWIGYFATNDENSLVGCGGYKGKPSNGKVEISYGTFKNFRGRGLGTEICRQLVELSLKTDSSVKITARTLPDNLGSIGILKKNHFECNGLLYDEEDGDVLEWELRVPSIK
ncbi:N-acetyltransferase [Adhaeribacter arboris]|uniref:N-acetyltransferase n=1 Tax=Adhaeribacter arboris TaxID=2072846 RepID=A0A2T2YPK7_9BACT|nr:GNAT family N-acetyltransferase [Adhaeribacter arboris]PSR57440.1 N-acetyltransferase [Adhaeribacter arboris]